MDGLRRKDTTKGPPLRILSLDGGGVRGYSIFIIVQELMHRTYVEIHGKAPRRHEIPKPADHFDLIVGTGTGGLIALMLGRLRLDLETCKELYVRMTRMVFETDKTILGIPTRPTLFKASKLEEAIKEAVRMHTTDDEEGNDAEEAASVRNSVASRSSAGSSHPRRNPSNASVMSFSARSPTAQFSRPYMSSTGSGDPNARLYDARERRTKTAVTAMFAGARKGEDPVLLRSYDSRREPAPEFDCTIWQAGRATSAIGLAFKPIRIGQSVFHDAGAGTFNPAPHALDEATVNEWPGRDVGVFISVGTGKRPGGSDANQTMWYEGFLGEFAEARRRLIAKIEGCETIHQHMIKEHLLKRGVNIDNYYRLNVEVGVGEFGMNEWHRLAEISTSTRRYLSRDAERKMVQDSAVKLSKIHRANIRFGQMGMDVPDLIQTAPDIAEPLAVELPGDMPTPFPPRNMSPSRHSYDSGTDTLSHPPLNTPSPRSSGDRPRPPASELPPPPHRPAPGNAPARPPPQRPPAGQGSVAQGSPRVHDDDHLVVTAPTPEQWRTASGQDKILVTAGDQPQRQQRPMRQGGGQQPHRIEPPPLPPKTPLPEHQAGNKRPGAPGLPYPLDDEAPPPVNMARKPGR